MFSFAFLSRHSIPLLSVQSDGTCGSGTGGDGTNDAIVPISTVGGALAGAIGGFVAGAVVAGPIGAPVGMAIGVCGGTGGGAVVGGVSIW